MPYRVDLRHAGDHVFDRLVELGALDAEVSQDGAVAALMPDSVAPAQVAAALGLADVAVSSAVGRDDESVWILNRRPIHVGRLRIVPAHMDAEPGAIRLLDSAAFGSGLHPTTVLCLEAVEEAVPDRLHRRWPGSRLVIVPDAGHSAGEPGIVSALVEASDAHRG